MLFGEILFQSGQGLIESAPRMGHASRHRDHSRKTVVCLVPIAGEIPLKLTAKEFRRMVSGTGPFVLEENHPRGVAIFIREIDPHPVLSGTLLIRLIDYLNPGFVSM